MNPQLLPLALLDMIGGSEILLIFLIVLLLFGGEKMPEVARGIAKSIREIKKVTAGVEEEFKKALAEPTEPAGTKTTPTPPPPATAAVAPETPPKDDPYHPQPPPSAPEPKA